nr:zinc finger BED domain-containing protein RICESLEEPER 2-like [Tanacetum cinerariifolium]
MTKKRKKNDRVVGAPNEEDWENVRDFEVDLDDGYERYLEECGDGVNSMEVEIYLADGPEKKIKGDDTYDVLNWWRLNSVKFPILSQVAKHVLGMPISTVASESAFSSGGRVIDKFRSSLTPKTAEALICAQDWLRSTPTDLQDVAPNGLQLQDLVEKLENLEIDLFAKRKQPCNETPMDEDSD